MYTTSYFTRVIAFCLFFILSSNILGGSYISYVLADELSGSTQSTWEIISVENDIPLPILAGDILSGSQEKTVNIDMPVVESTGSTVVIVDTWATISVESGSIDSSSGVILVSTWWITSTGSSLSPESPTADLSSFCTGTTDTVIEIANEATTKIVKDYIENIDTKDLDTVTASWTDKEISQQLKETILDGYMDGTEKTKLTQDQMNSNLSISENEVTTILRDAIMDKWSDDIHLFIKTDLNIGKLQELFVFFDSTGSYLFNEQYIDPVDSLTVYEMIFSRDSTFWKRIVDYLYAGVVPDNFFDQIQIIRPGLIYGLADTGYLSGETSSLNWWIPKIKANLYQSLFVGKPRIKIGVIDTGVDINHPDLAANIYTNPAEIAGNRLDDDNNGYIDDVHGYSFVYNTGVVTDVHSHGTHVAGIIWAAVNGRGIYGVYSQALIVPLKALWDTGNGSTYGISNAIRYAADNGISVINMSLWGAGTPNQNDILCAAITYARSKWTISVVSAWNSNINITWFSPSWCRDALAVGAVDSNLAKASFSNYGTGVLVSAPGVSIYSTIPRGGYIQKSGTSMAAPFVAGAIWAIFAMKGTMDLNQVRDILSKNGDTITTTAPMWVSLNLDKIFLSLGISSNLSNPVITLSGASPMNVTLGSVFVDPGATCRDNYDLTCVVTKTGTVNTSLSWAYIITYSTRDSSGNNAINVLRIVRVSDLIPPVITLSGASTMSIALGNVFVDPGATCRDNYDLTCTVTKTGTVNTSLSGTYLIMYRAVDTSGNIAGVISRMVSVYPVAAVAPTPSSPGLGGGGGGGGSYGWSPATQPVVTNPIVTQPVVPPTIPTLPKGFVINKELLQRFNIRLPIVPAKKIVVTLPKIQSGTVKEFVEKVGIYGTVYNTSDLIVRSAKNTASTQVSQKLNRWDRLYVSTRDQNGWSFVKTTTGEWWYVRSHYIHLQNNSK